MDILLSIIYLIATVSFIVGLKLLGHPETAKKGNSMAALGMGLAILAAIFLSKQNVPNINYVLIALALLVGGVIGWLIAIKVEMTKMPELVSLFNGFGGASAALVWWNLET
jgi:NAD(P) transhydrogenase subunit beta